MNILVTAIGSYAGKAVISSLKNAGHQVIGCDINPGDWLSQTQLTDRFYKAPLYSSENYLSFLQDIATGESLDLIIPLTDPEVDRLAGCTPQFEEAGCRIAISGADSVKLVRNKWSLFKYLKSNTDIPLIPTFRSVKSGQFSAGTLLLAKPVAGRSSQEITHFSSDEPAPVSLESRKHIIQPRLKGDIFTADCFRTAEGEINVLVRKELIRTPHGAGTTVEIVKHPYLERTTGNILDVTGYTGIANIEFLYSDGRYMVMDFNPRYSAGIGFSIKAGLNFPDISTRYLQGEKLPGKRAVRYGIYTKSETIHQLNIKR